MRSFQVPLRAEVSENNQALFDQLEKGLGFVPNLYATFAYSRTALGNYLTFQNAKSSLRARERELINLVVSQVNECRYCLAAHTALGQKVGFTPEQLLEIRTGRASFDPKFDALARLVKSVTENRGEADPELVENFFAAGYTNENLVDTLLVVGDKIISNYLHKITQIPVDFPAAPALDSVAV